MKRILAMLTAAVLLLLCGCTGATPAPAEEAEPAKEQGKE